MKSIWLSKWGGGVSHSPPAAPAIMLSVIACLGGITSTAEGTGSAASTNKDLVVLNLDLPAATTKGTPEEVPAGPHIEKVPDLNAPKQRPDFFVPKGVKNVALGRKPTSSSEKLYSGTLEQITDGLKAAIDDDVVELRKGRQWVQLDLGKDCRLYAIVVWHDHCWLQVFHDVVVQAADDPQFTKNVRTLFNNDVDNSSGLGMGTDKEYFETFAGKLIDPKGLKARHLRFYTNGSNMNEAANRYQEIEVYALPAD